MTNELDALHYLFTESDGAIAAHCLDLDIASSGRDLGEAEASLDRLVQFYLTRSEHRQKAPRKYWNDLSHAAQMEPKTLELDVPPGAVTVHRGQDAITVLRSQFLMVAA
ncbi:MAG: hypothetical protein WAL32_12460 [Terriglobales bacterium]